MKPHFRPIFFCSLIYFSFSFFSFCFYVYWLKTGAWQCKIKFWQLECAAGNLVAQPLSYLLIIMVTSRLWPLQATKLLYSALRAVYLLFQGKETSQGKYDCWAFIFFSSFFPFYFSPFNWLFSCIILICGRFGYTKFIFPRVEELNFSHVGSPTKRAIIQYLRSDLHFR